MEPCSRFDIHTATVRKKITTNIWRYICIHICMYSHTLCIVEECSIFRHSNTIPHNNGHLTIHFAHNFSIKSNSYRRNSISKLHQRTIQRKLFSVLFRNSLKWNVVWNSCFVQEYVCIYDWPVSWSKSSVACCIFFSL